MSRAVRIVGSCRDAIFGPPAATGEALGEALWRSDSFDKASSLALKYHESTGNDEVLAAFLKSDAARHRAADKAKALIDQIRDPALQEEIRSLEQYKDKQ